ncbi:MAG: NAD-dependent epimerase/dehydratase family protein [Phycisphaerales bacterium JB040]
MHRPDEHHDHPSCLVTGGAGFIGSHLVDRLVSLGRRVTVLDDLSTGRASNLDGVRDRVELVEGDVARIGDLLPDRRFDEIYHLAAAVGVRLVLEDPIRAIETNVHGTAAVLEYAQRHDSPPTLVASSSEVYGKPNTGVFSEDDDCLYGPTTTTRWSYAATKALDEHLALAYDRLRAVPVVVCRFFNTVGPRQVGDYGMVVPAFVAAALRGEPITIYGDGEQSRCFCDARDVAAVLPALLAHPGARARVINVGHDEPVTIAGLADLVTETLASDSPIRKIPYSDAYPAGFEDLRQRRPDLSRLRDLTGFQPRIPLRQTILDLAAESPAGRPGIGRTQPRQTGGDA